MTTLYDVLGVNPTANDQEIKQAWRTLVRRYHPDTSGSAASMDDFERVQHAYEVLSNIARRLEYDRRTFGYSHAGLSALKARIRRSRKPTPRPGDDIRVAIDVPFDTMITGGTVSVEATRLVICTACEGWCTADGRAPEICPSCEGEGMTSAARPDGKAIIRSCGQCGGRGVLIDAPCSTCSSAGRVVEKFERTVSIPAGLREGMNIRIGPGHDGIFGGQAGDLYVVPAIERHPYYRRQGDGLGITMLVNPLSAMLGGELRLPPLAGKPMPAVRFLPFVNRVTLQTASPWDMDVSVDVRVTMPEQLNEKVVGTIEEAAAYLDDPRPAKEGDL